MERNRSLSIDAFANRVSHRRETDDVPAANYTYVCRTRRGSPGSTAAPAPKARRDATRSCRAITGAGNLTGVTFNSWVDKTPPNTVGPIWEITSFSTSFNRYSGDRHLRSSAATGRSPRRLRSCADGRLVYSERTTSQDVDQTDHVSLDQYGYKHLVSNAGLGRGVHEEQRHDALGRRVWTRAHRHP